MDNQTIISIVAIVVSGAVGITGILLSLRKLWESDSIGRASRRTIALQMLSDEELALQKVKAECLSLELLIHANQQQLDATFDHLETESKRIVRESKELLRNVRKKRKEVVGRILDMKSSDIEAVIAEAYNGRMLAEAQLYTTIRSREDTIRVYMNQ
jgi:hypothetical protein